MKRLLFIVVIWGAALLPPVAQAQRGRGMGFRGAGPVRGPSGFAGRPSGFAGRPSGFGSRPATFAARPAPAGRFAPGMRVVSPQSRFISGRTGRTFFPHHRRFNRFGRNRFGRNRFFPGNCFNGFFDPFCNNGFFFGSGFIDPFDPFFSGFSSSYYPPPEQQPVIVEQNGNGREGELAMEVQELSEEIQAMREEQQKREAPAGAASKPSAQDLGPDTILVFRDGLQLPVRNYAIAGDSVWVLDEHKARKIPLSKLDVAATEQANAKNGVEIHLP